MRRRVTIPLFALTCAIAPLRAQGGRDLTAVGSILPPYPEQFSPEDALDLNRYAIGDMTRDGLWLAVTNTVGRDTFGTDYRRDGDPTYVHPIPARVWIIDGTTRARTEVFPDKRGVRSLQFSPDGKQLAMLLWTGELYEPAVYDRASKRLATLRLPKDDYVAEGSDLRWTPDGKALVVALHTMEWRRRAQASFKEMTAGPVFVQNARTPFLVWDELRRDATWRSVGTLDVKTSQYHELLPETAMTFYVVADDGSAVSYGEDLSKGTPYETAAADARLMTRSVATGAKRVLVPSIRRTPVTWAPDGKHYAFARDGRVSVAAIDDSTVLGIPFSSSPNDGPSSGASGDYQLSRFSPQGDALLVTSSAGIWVVDLATRAKALVMAASDTTVAAGSPEMVAWSNDGSKLYFTTRVRGSLDRAVVRFDRKTGQLATLVKDSRRYADFWLSSDGTRTYLAVAESNRPSDIFAANGDLGGLHRFVVSNPQMEAKRFGTIELMHPTDSEGHPATALVLYPPNYQRGKAYPTVFLLDTASVDDRWDVTANVLSGAGFVVVKPALGVVTGGSVEEPLKAINAAAKALIALAVTDSTRMGIQGSGDAGYATTLLITQTARFRAAIDISGAVDLISYYTDSPRLGARNVMETEALAGGATLWKQPDAFLRQSPVLGADRITTSLMLVTGGQDADVPAENTREMFYALRRLGRDVVWVDYVNGGHGGGTASTTDYIDMYQRIVGWYDEKLKRRGQP